MPSGIKTEEVVPHFPFNNPIIMNERKRIKWNAQSTAWAWPVRCP